MLAGRVRVRARTNRPAVSNGTTSANTCDDIRSPAAGLSATVGVLDKVYATGRKCAAGFRKTMRIVFDDPEAQVELPRRPQRRVQSGSYSGRVPN